MSANSLNSAVAEHSLEHGHSIKWDGAEVVSVSQRWYHRCFVESCLAHQRQQVLNEQRQGFSTRDLQQFSSLILLTLP